MKSVLLRRITIGATLLAVAGATVQAANASAAPVGQRFAAAPTITTGCQLGNGVQHVVELVFDNVHFARDNPNVPSDLEQMPHLLNFLKTYGTVFSNSHTPMIAHTADDSLTIYTGLYGDRHGQPLTNTYKTYNSDGSTDPATSFAYWTDPVDDTAASASIGHDTTPSMAYSASVPATGAPNKITPAPWVPFTRAGCSVGDFSTANMVLENANFDIPEVFGGSSPEATQLATDSDSFKDNEVADYVGVAVHCAQGDTVCANAQGIKNGQSTPTPTASTDALPTEPGGYHGYQALFGARYVAPQLGAGTPNVAHNGFQVTNASGNLVDENGNQINGAFTSNRPGFPGFSPTPSQTLAYMADMQEAGIPVTYGYISDMHERKAGTEQLHHRRRDRFGQADRPGRQLLRHERAELRQRVQHVLPAPAGRRNHAGQHRVRHQRGRERPVRRRQRRAGRPAHSGQLRRRDDPVQLRHQSGGRAAGQHRRPARRHSQREHVLRHRAARRVDLRARQPDREGSDDAATGTRHGRDDRRQSVLRRDRSKDREVPGQCTGGTGPAHADRGSSAIADVHDVPGAGLLLLHDRGRTSASTAGSRGITATTAPTSTSPGPRSLGLGSRRTASTARSRRRATKLRIRTRQIRCRRRARWAPGWRRPISARR